MTTRELTEATMSDADDPIVKMMPLSELKMEEGAEELMKSPEAKIYLRAIGALMQENQSDAAFDELRQLPLEKRYIWRVASALKWAFVDLDGDSVMLDRQTAPKEDLQKVAELLRLRPLQFCLFLKALLGGEGMEKTMTEAVRRAKSLG
jgi:hypothetical protein